MQDPETAAESINCAIAELEEAVDCLDESPRLKSQLKAAITTLEGLETIAKGLSPETDVPEEETDPCS